MENGLVVHWDGKLLPDITNIENVDRLPIIATQEDSEQLLGLPKQSSGTGAEIASAVFNHIQSWKLEDKVQEICFDTTSTNTGQFNGAAVLLEKLMNRTLMYLPCRHHIYELVLKYVFLKKVLNSTTVGPRITIFHKFKNSWGTFDLNFYNYGITDRIVKKIVKPAQTKETATYCLNQLEKDICRDDYREFLELVIIFVGYTLPNGNRFHKPGASHHARWMSKAIYALKIFIFRDQFQLTQNELDGIRDVCFFLVLIYAKAWFNSNQSIETANNDMQFINNSIYYSKIDPVVSEIMINKISNHLWYLGSETIEL